MTAEAQLALVNALVPIITSIGVVISGLVALRIAESKAAAERSKEAVVTKLDQIHELTNSNLTNLRNQIQAQEVLIREMLTQKAAEARGHETEPPKE